MIRLSVHPSGNSSWGPMLRFQLAVPFARVDADPIPDSDGLP